MRKFNVILIVLSAGIFLTLAVSWIGSFQEAQAKSSQSISQTSGTSSTMASDENDLSFVSNTEPTQDDEILPDGISLDSQPVLDALPTPIPGQTLVYFVPSDNDATATVLYLYNTDSAAHTVALRGFSYNGVLVYSLNINIAATSFLRLASDSIASAPPPSWATPAPIITNFTDFTYFASLSLPKGVKAEGYILFNPGTGVVNPRLDQGAIPLRFSTDPATLFLPSVQTVP